MCAKKGPRLRNHGKMAKYISGTSFERIALEIPLTESGNKYLMAVMDSSTVAEAFIEHLIARHSLLDSDQERNFEYELKREILS